MSDEKEIEDSEIPAKWRELDLEGMVSEGWRPRIKKKGSKSYLTMRFGNQERSLGPATEELVNLFCGEFPELGNMLTSIDAPRSQTESKVLLHTPIKKPQEIGTGYRPSLEVLNWYSWAKNKGFQGSLGDFVNEATHNYFNGMGWRLAVVKGGN